MRKIITLELNTTLNARDYCLGGYGEFNKIRYDESHATMYGTSIALVGEDGIAVGLINCIPGSIEKFEKIANDNRK